MIEIKGGCVIDDEYMFNNWYRLAGHLAGDVLLHDLTTAGDHKPFEIAYPLITEGEDFYIKDSKIFYYWEDGKVVGRGSGDIVDFDDSFTYCQLLAMDGYYHLCK